MTDRELDEASGAAATAWWKDAKYDYDSDRASYEAGFVAGAKWQAARAAPATLDRKRFRDNPPCYICGYNGPSYFNPFVHPCAAMYHRDAAPEQPYINPEGNTCTHHPDDPAHGPWCVATDEELRAPAQLVSERIKRLCVANGWVEPAVGGAGRPLYVLPEEALEKLDETAARAAPAQPEGEPE